MAPAFLQRAAIVTFVSFAFFLLTLIAFYVRQHIGYFALSTAFLVVYIFTLISWVLQKRNVVRIFENGLSYKRFRAAWYQVRSVKASKLGLEIKKGRTETIVIPPSISGYEQIVKAVRKGIETTEQR